MPRTAIRKIATAVVVAAGAIVVLGGVGHAQLKLYDDFNAPGIDPDKWIGTESFAAPLNPNTEAARLIRGGALRVKLTTYGNTDSNRGYPIGRFGLALPNPGAVTAMAAKVTVRQADTEDCANNLAPSRARAHLIGIFFNDGSSTGPEDRTGDIGAAIQKHRDRDGNHIVAYIFPCPDAACHVAPNLATYVFNTTWTPGRPDTLSIQWDAAGNQFLFGVNAGTPQEETVALPYAQSDSLPAAFGFKEMRVHNTPAHCTAGRRKVSIDATFDDVRLNPEAVP